MVWPEVFRVSADVAPAEELLASNNGYVSRQHQQVDNVANLHVTNLRFQQACSNNLKFDLHRLTGRKPPKIR